MKQLFGSNGSENMRELEIADFLFELGDVGGEADRVASSFSARGHSKSSPNRANAEAIAAAGDVPSSVFFSLPRSCARLGSLQT